MTIIFALKRTHGFAAMPSAYVRQWRPWTAHAFVLCFFGALGLLESCSPPPQQTTLPCALAVREHQLRFDAPLPIVPNQKVSLLQFLAAGGDRRVMGEDAVVPGAMEKYGPLLDLLEQPENLHSEKIATNAFSKWFSGKPTFQVVDSRDEDVPPAGSVLAYCDGAFWWIFHQKDGQLIRLIVMKANPANK